MANILIVGGTGCVGTETTQALIKQGGHKIVCLSRAISAKPNIDGITFEKGDILEPSSLSAVLDKHQISHVLHAAALRTSDCKSDPRRAIEINVTGTANLLEATRHYGKVERLVFISTAAIYQVPADNSFVSETSPVTPLNAYTATKLAAEQLVECYANNYAIPSTILRPQIIYGLSRGAEGSTAGVSTAIKAAAQGEDYTIPFGGTTGFHYAPDVGKNTALALIESTKYFTCYNLPCESLTLSGISETINSTFDNSNIDHVDTVYPFASGLDDTAFKQDFTEYSLTPFTSAIQQMREELS